MNPGDRDRLLVELRSEHERARDRMTALGVAIGWSARPTRAAVKVARAIEHLIATLERRR